MTENKFNSVRELIEHVEDEARRRIEERLKEAPHDIGRPRDDSATEQISDTKESPSRGSQTS